MAAPSVAAEAAGKATSNSYNVRNTKLNVLNSDPAATSLIQIFRYSDDHHSGVSEDLFMIFAENKSLKSAHLKGCNRLT